MSTLFVTRNELETTLPAVCKYFDKALKSWRKQSVVEIGPPGTGKTTLVFMLARSPQLVAWYNEVTGLELSEIPVYTTTCHPDATAPEVYGQYLPVDGVWTFLPGAMLRAWGYKWLLGGVSDKTTGYDNVNNAPPPGIHLLDDIHLMGPGGQAAMYKSFDNGAGANFLDPYGKLHFPHQAALAFGTMNGEIDSLEPAVVDRAAVKVPVMEPSDGQLEQLDPMFRDLCAADYNQNMEPIATYREWLSISLNRPVVGLGKAVLLSLGNPDRTKRLIEAIARNEAAGFISGREARDTLHVIIKGTPVGV